MKRTLTREFLELLGLSNLDVRTFSLAIVSLSPRILETSALIIYPDDQLMNFDPNCCLHEIEHFSGVHQIAPMVAENSRAPRQV